MYITLSEAKKHLNIDDSFNDDNDYIISLILASEDAIAHHLDRELKSLVVGGKLPPAIKHSILLLVGNLYANRESVTYGNMVNIPYTYEYLLGLYKKYYLP